MTIDNIVPKKRRNVSSQQQTKHNCLPPPLIELLTILICEGFSYTDLFRLSDNNSDVKTIIGLMENGAAIEWDRFHIYTLANVLKRFLMRLPNGLFTKKGEMKLLRTLNATRLKRLSCYNKLVMYL